MDDSSEKFAKAFGDALRQFLDERGITATEASDRIGINKQTLSTYWTEKEDGTRAKARAEVLFGACAQLGFRFDYAGYQISAIPLKGANKSLSKAEQLALPFSRAFELANDKGTVTVTVKRPPGRVELSLSLRAVS